MIYETAPWGFLDQPKFLNQVLEIDTCLSPLSLLAYLKRIETDLGRTPTFHFGPRLIDIDILLYGDQVIELADLVVPHPQMHERAFVLIPLAELAPNACHPTLGQTIGQLLTQVDTSGVEVYRG